jgi:dTMP kinase
VTDDRSAHLVTLDGPSGVGKTTLTHALAAVLQQQGHRTLPTTTPSTNAIGQLARTRELRGHALSCLVAADRYQHDHAVVQPALHAGTTVICDRYMPSALVFDQLDDVPPEYVRAVYAALPTPHTALVLVGEPAVCAARAAARGAAYSRFHSADIRRHQRERTLFEQAIQILIGWCYPVVRVDIGSDSPQVIAQRLATIVRTREENS